MDTRPTMGTADREVRGISMDTQYHVTCLVAENGNGVLGKII